MPAARATSMLGAPMAAAAGVVAAGIAAAGILGAGFASGAERAGDARDGRIAVPNLRYLALGDSYTIGEGVDAAGRWPVQLAQALRARGVAIDDPQIVARTGWTTDELDAAIDTAIDAEFVQTASEASADVSAARSQRGPAPVRFDFVTLLIGVNNQYRGRSLAEYEIQFEGLLRRAIGFADGRAGRVMVLAIPDWGVTPFAAQSGRDTARIARELDAFNAAAARICAERGVAFVDIAPVSRTRGAETAMLAEDGLHPSAAMYAQWTALALPTAERLLRDAPR